ncbi:DUF1841 family protein [Chitinivorax sp. B]|uniref:DUF1841 family protein n=1 Tax=Chitinivorax sp. B TaxID=2502235 RepID=UPI0010F5EEFD|nr:DUF1841 family protein [Chitinivorax sp. B]
MFNPTRDQARQFLFDTWRKYREQQPLTDLEKITIGILVAHPEYHTMLDQPDRYLDRDYLPEHGNTNPFLHLSMHLAIEEQLSIDQPAGVKALYLKLCEQQQDEHAALHDMMDCLAEMIWHAQRYQTSPDPAIYLGCLRRKLGQQDSA